AMLWMLVALAVTSSLTAAIIGATNASSVVEFPRDLQDKVVGVVQDAPASTYLQSRGQEVNTFKTAKEGLLAMDRDEIAVFVHDATTLHHLSRVYPALRTYIQQTDARPEAYAFAVREDSPLYEPLDRAVIEITTTSAWQTVVASYGDASRSASGSRE
ncbi:MAG: transporter substrate-binding domain-containing protein, partial [Lewinella sp.]